MRHNFAILEEAAIVMLQEIWIPRGSKFRVLREFRQKYPEYEGHIAAGSDIDLVVDTQATRCQLMDTMTEDRNHDSHLSGHFST